MSDINTILKKIHTKKGIPEDQLLDKLYKEIKTSKEKQKTSAYYRDLAHIMTVLDNRTSPYPIDTILSHPIYDFVAKDIKEGFANTDLYYNFIASDVLQYHHRQRLKEGDFEKNITRRVVLQDRSRPLLTFEHHTDFYKQTIEKMCAEKMAFERYYHETGGIKESLITEVRNNLFYTNDLEKCIIKNFSNKIISKSQDSNFTSALLFGKQITQAAYFSLKKVGFLEKAGKTSYFLDEFTDELCDDLEKNHHKMFSVKEKIDIAYRLLHYYPEEGNIKQADRAFNLMKYFFEYYPPTKDSTFIGTITRSIIDYSLMKYVQEENLSFYDKALSYYRLNRRAAKNESLEPDSGCNVKAYSIIKRYGFDQFVFEDAALNQGSDIYASWLSKKYLLR